MPTPAYTMLKGVVTADLVNCRYGPGEPYLYEFGLIKALKLRTRDEWKSAALVRLRP